jgi:RNA polymerase sigma-70 factor (ECF subfamily)
MGVDVPWLYERLSRRLLIYFTRRTCDAEVALDLVAETFARALEGRFRGRSEGEAIAWIWGIARNLLAEYFKRGRIEQRALRRLGVERIALRDDEVARIEELAGLGDLRAAVAGALATLGADQREALRLRVVEELDYAAVAGRLGISEPTARARVSRGLRKLAEALDASPEAAL